jgi:hypothetical protein
MTVKTEDPMTDMTALRQAVDHLLEGRLGSLLELLVEDVEFEVAGSRIAWGKAAVAEYFTALGALPAFWQIDYGTEDGQVIAWGKESFTLQGSGLEGGCEFAMVFDLSGGRIVRLLMIEDLSQVVTLSGAKGAKSWRGPLPPRCARGQGDKVA